MIAPAETGKTQVLKRCRGTLPSLIEQSAKTDWEPSHSGSWS
jgi:hypothetical protein